MFILFFSILCIIKEKILKNNVNISSKANLKVSVWCPSFQIVPHWLNSLNSYSNLLINSLKPIGKKNSFKLYQNFN